MVAERTTQATQVCKECQVRCSIKTHSSGQMAPLRVRSIAREGETEARGKKTEHK